MTISARNRLILFVKTPVAGRVKTRLGKDIGIIPATWWYRHQVARLLRKLADPRWRIILAVAPDRQFRTAAFPGQLPRIAQGDGGLGQRMARALRYPGSGNTLIVGSDIPDVSRSHINDAFRRLGSTDFVFGPATDGGFWLVGASSRRALPPTLFRQVRWSGPHALADALKSLDGRTFGLVATLRDVDDAQDL